MQKLKTALLLFSLALMIGCAKPKALVYKDVTGVRVQKLDLEQAVIVLDLKFYNPNSYSLSLKNGDLNAYISDRFVGKATVDERTAIPARDTFMLPVSVTANLSTLVTNALRLLRHNNEALPVRLQGTVRAGKGGVFFPIHVNYSGMQKISL